MICLAPFQSTMRAFEPLVWRQQEEVLRELVGTPALSNQGADT